MRSKRFPILIISVCLALILALPLVAGCAKEAAGPEPGAPTPTGELPSYGTWRFGSIMSTEQPLYKAEMDWVNRVEERSDGRIDIEIYPNSQLGDWVELFEVISTGMVDLGLTVAVESYDPRLGIDWVPYRYFTWDQAREAYEPGGWISDIVGGLLEDNNLKMLGYGSRGFCGVSLKECPDVLPPEPCGMKIRTPPISSWKKAWEVLGYLPVAIPMAEVYTSIQTGVVVGQAGGGTEQMYCVVGDIQGCWIQTNDWNDTFPLSMNLDLWNSIDPRDQKLLLDTMTEMLWEPGGYWDRVQADEDMWRQKALEDYGIKSIILDDAQLAKCAKAVREAVWPDLEADLGSVVYNKMVEWCPPVE